LRQEDLKFETRLGLKKIKRKLYGSSLRLQLFQRQNELPQKEIISYKSKGISFVGKPCCREVPGLDYRPGLCVTVKV
jgi:hypothetical protein